MSSKCTSLVTDSTLTTYFLSQFIPLDECKAALLFGNSTPQNPAAYPDDANGVDDDSLDGAGASSLPNSVWTLEWSISSASKKLEDLEESSAIAQTVTNAVKPLAKEDFDLNIIIAKPSVKRPTDGQLQKQGAVSESEGDVGSKGKVEDLEDEANSSNVSDLKRGKRFKKLTKMLCNVQVR